ncbi:MAG TPA: response regulator [Candidatus Acidoferrales bacterium]|nr:response regulator [Candidatus Acidoferrales bacterium]
MQNVLFITDQPQVRNFTAAYLRRSYFAVQEVAPASAIELMQKNAYDVVIADSTLPKSSALMEALACHKRAWPNKGRILLTFSDSPALAHACRVMDVLYLPKPVRLDELRQKIEAFENRSRLMPCE